MFGQTTNLGGVSLSYDKKTHTLKLFVPNTVVTSEDQDWQKEIIIKTTIVDTFYYACGRKYNMGSEFTYKFPKCDKCQFEPTTTEYFILKHPPKGEYILSVSDICNEKWRTNNKTSSIIIK